MDRDTAIVVWTELEELRFEGTDTKDGFDAAEVQEDPWTPPIYDVRLDAYVRRQDDERAYRIRVQGNDSVVDTADWKRVLELAEEHDLAVDLSNSAIELR